jgi:tRNA-dihydrouridine synthase A
VTVKNRLGVDDQDPEVSLFGFVETVAKAGVTVFVVHARKAILKGLSPKDNREIPPLNYDLVRTLKAAHPHLTIILNGGIGSIQEAQEAVTGLDGVMLGRAAYHDPALLGHVDGEILGYDTPIVTPEEAYRAYRPYVERRLGEGVPLHAITRHMLGLFAGRPGARLYRRHLGETSRAGAGIEVYDEALALIEREASRFASRGQIAA